MKLIETISFLFSFNRASVPVTLLDNFAVGVSTAQPDHLKFLFEMNEDFCVLPSYAVIPSMMALRGLFGGQVPGLSVDPTKVPVVLLFSVWFLGRARL